MRKLPHTQWVIRQFIIPAKEGDFAMVFDKSGQPKNAVAKLIDQITNILPISSNIQVAFDEYFNNEKILMLMRLYDDGKVGRSGALTQRSAVWLQLLQGVDLDHPPYYADSFSGKETFGLLYPPKKQGLLKGTMSKGQLQVGPDPMTMQVFYKYARTLILDHGLCQAEVTANTITGTIGGIISHHQAEESLYPIAVDMINELLDSLSLDDPSRKMILGIFDAEPYDGKVSVKELIDNDLAKEVIAPDLDTDGDGIKDAFTAAVGFEAVPCRIVP